MNQNPQCNVEVTVDCRLPWCRRQSTVAVPCDFLVEDALRVAGIHEDPEHYFLVADGKVCLPDHPLPADGLIRLFPLMMGG